jgi:hypothetical protein
MHFTGTKTVTEFFLIAFLVFFPFLGKYKILKTGNYRKTVAIKILKVGFIEKQNGTKLAYPC